MGRQPSRPGWSEVPPAPAWAPPAAAAPARRPRSHPAASPPRTRARAGDDEPRPEPREVRAPDFQPEERSRIANPPAPSPPPVPCRGLPRSRGSSAAHPRARTEDCPGGRAGQSRTDPSRRAQRPAARPDPRSPRPQDRHAAPREGQRPSRVGCRGWTGGGHGGPARTARSWCRSSWARWRRWPSSARSSSAGVQAGRHVRPAQRRVVSDPRPGEAVVNHQPRRAQEGPNRGDAPGDGDPQSKGAQLRDTIVLKNDPLGAYYEQDDSVRRAGTKVKIIREVRQGSLKLAVDPASLKDLSVVQRPGDRRNPGWDSASTRASTPSRSAATAQGPGAVRRGDRAGQDHRTAQADRSARGAREGVRLRRRRTARSRCTRSSRPRCTPGTSGRGAASACGSVVLERVEREQPADERLAHARGSA